MKRALFVSPEDYEFVSKLQLWVDPKERDPVMTFDPFSHAARETSLVHILVVRVWRTCTSHDQVLHYRNGNKFDLRRENVLLTHWEDYYRPVNKLET